MITQDSIKFARNALRSSVKVYATSPSLSDHAMLIDQISPAGLKGRCHVRIVENHRTILLPKRSTLHTQSGLNF